MRIKLDENINRHFAAHLRSLGYDATSADEEQLTHKTDEEVARVAFAENRSVFTLDVGFGDTRRFPPGRRPAIVVFRPAQMEPACIHAAILKFLASNDSKDIEGRTVIVEPGRTRVRWPEPWDDPQQGPPEVWQKFDL